MDFGILGPLAVWKDGRELGLGGVKQRSVLCVLLLRANEPVAVTTIVDELWGAEPPPTAVKAVQVHVFHLRKVLGEGALETSRRDMSFASSLPRSTRSGSSGWPSGADC